MFHSPEGRIQGVWKRFNSKNELQEIHSGRCLGQKWSRIAENLDAWLLQISSKPAWMHSGRYSILVSIIHNAEREKPKTFHTPKTRSPKAELLQEGIFFLLQLFARDVLVMKKLEIEKTKPTFIISTFKTGTRKVGLVFSISNFSITKTSLANKWMRKKIPSCSNSALHKRC